jgi:phosphoglucosamine mutase
LRKLFGTDGIRGVAGEYPLDHKTIFAIGRAVGHHLPAGPRRVVIGQDTRESSSWITAVLAGGLAASGVEVESAGVITTPGIAHLTHTHGFSAGIVISASHNPWQDNGIKLFGPDGYKLPDSTELQIETEIFALLNAPEPEVIREQPLVANLGLHSAYVDWLAHEVSGLGHIRAVIDCANGAASAIAPEVFTQVGIDARYTHSSPDGRNINENCGALHPEVVSREVVSSKADIGICFLRSPGKRGER